MGRTIALATRYEVKTHVLSSWLTDRDPAMCGSETFAMLVSSTSMNVAIVTTRAMAHGLWPPVQPVLKQAGSTAAGERASAARFIRARPSARPTPPGAGDPCPLARRRSAHAPE